MARVPLISTGISYLERRTMSAALAALYAAGGGLTLLSIALPHPDGVNELGAGTNAVIAIAAAIVVWIWGRNLPLPAFHILVALGSGLIALGVHFGGYAIGTPSYGLFFLWVIVYSFSFFSLIPAMLQAGLAACAHLTVLSIDGRAPGLITDWTVTWGILFVTGLVVGWLSGQVRELAVTDTLTGLRNRRAWEDELQREMARASRTQQPLSVLMLDVDALKTVNDTRGHQAGDLLLKEIGAAWSGALRSGDFLARLSGDEFGVLLSACSAEGARVILRRLKMATEHSFSGGYAQWDGKESAQDLTHRADLSLYETKRLRPQGAGRRRDVDLETETNSS